MWQHRGSTRRHLWRTPGDQLLVPRAPHDIPLWPWPATFGGTSVLLPDPLSLPLPLFPSLKLKAACFHSSPRLAAPWSLLMAQMVKNLPVMQETQVLSLGWEDPLDKGMATHSSFLAWRIPWTEEPGGLHGVTKSQTPPSHRHQVRHPSSPVQKDSTLPPTAWRPPDPISP